MKSLSGIAALFVMAASYGWAQDGPRKVVPAGGWSVNDQAFAISYQPTRHADGFMKSWLSISAAHAGKSSAAEQVFNTLADKKQAGQCIKCHSVDQLSSGEKVVHWAGRRPGDDVSASTRFSHAPHLLVLKDDAAIDDKDSQSGSCFTCHSLSGQKSETFVARYFDDRGKLTFNPHVGASNFVPISKNACASCHQEKVAGNNCTLCHLYHHK